MREFPPTLLDRFTPERLIAAGGFGSVWLARQRVLDRLVAVKTLHAELAQTEEQVRRFHDEARVTAAFSHPGVVRLLDYGVESTVPWMAFEYVEGQSLRGLVEKGPQPWRVVAEIGRQVALALEQARRAAIIHRDIKPDNILECEPGRYKVADFGIAKWAGASVKTQDGMILGTPAYLSPIQIQGHAPAHQSDLYALGVTLFELVTGELPFYDENPMVLLERHRVTPPPTIRSLVPEVPLDFDRIVARLLAKKREDRYESASEVADALAALLKDPARPSSRTLRVVPTALSATVAVSRPRTSHRNRGLIGLIVAALALVLCHHLLKAPSLPAVVPQPSTASAAVDAARDLRNVAEIGDEIERVQTSVSRCRATFPADHELLTGKGRAKVGVGLAELAKSSNQFARVLRHVNTYQGPHAAQLLVLERVGDELVEAAGRILRFSIVGLFDSEPSTNAAQRELGLALNRVRAELGVVPQAKLIGVLSASLAPRLAEATGRGHVVSVQTTRAALLRAAQLVETVEKAEGGRSIDGLVEQIHLLHRLASWEYRSFLSTGKMMVNPLEIGPETRRARDALVVLAGELVRTPFPPDRFVDDLDTALWSIVIACSAAAADRGSARIDREGATRLAVMTLKRARPAGFSTNMANVELLRSLRHLLGGVRDLHLQVEVVRSIEEAAHRLDEAERAAFPGAGPSPQSRPHEK